MRGKEGLSSRHVLRCVLPPDDPRRIHDKIARRQIASNGALKPYSVLVALKATPQAWGEKKKRMICKQCVRVRVRAEGSPTLRKDPHRCTPLSDSAAAGKGKKSGAIDRP